MSDPTRNIMGPALSLRAIPEPSAVPALIAADTTFWAGDRLKRPEELSASYGWRVRVAPIGGPELHALLIPADDGTATVLVNSERDTARSVEWLIAHEVAHAFFLTAAGFRRRPPGDEESFCDLFAETYLRQLSPATTAPALKELKESGAVVV